MILLSDMVSGGGVMVIIGRDGGKRREGMDK